jgi:hypothetical protein
MRGQWLTGRTLAQAMHHDASEYSQKKRESSCRFMLGAARSMLRKMVDHPRNKVQLW